MIVYESACKSDLSEISDLHLKCFDGYFLSSLGKNLIEKYYQQFLYEENLFVIAKDTELNKIIGFCMGYYNPSTARAHFEQQYKADLIKRLLWLSLKLDRNAITRCRKRLLSAFKKKSKVSTVGCPEAATLLSICVLDEYRGTAHGVSSALFHRFEAKLKENNIKSYTLSVKPDNIRAIKFYTKNNMKHLEHSKDCIRYIKTLN